MLLLLFDCGLAAYIGVIMFAAFMVATMVPFFKVTGLLERFIRVTPAHLDPGLMQLKLGRVYSSKSSHPSVKTFNHVVYVPM